MRFAPHNCSTTVASRHPIGRFFSVAAIASRAVDQLLVAILTTSSAAERSTKHIMPLDKVTWLGWSSQQKSITNYAVHKNLTTIFCYHNMRRMQLFYQNVANMLKLFAERALLG
jgi:hypothetical protein